MAYRSESQRKFFHTNTAKDQGISASTVHEFDKASKGLKLPEHVKGSKFHKLKKKLRGK